jgi:threonine/homoserine/homoserine lactone efflux protein
MERIVALLAQMMNREAAGGFLVLWFLITVGVIVGWVIFLIAVWRAMRAHESIAISMDHIARRSGLPAQQPAGPQGNRPGMV